MIAETALSVIEALPEKEYKRLLNMLNVVSTKQKKNKVSGTTKSERLECLIKFYNPKK